MHNPPKSLCADRDQQWMLFLIIIKVMENMSAFGLTRSVKEKTTNELFILNWPLTASWIIICPSGTKEGECDADRQEVGIVGGLTWQTADQQSAQLSFHQHCNLFPTLFYLRQRSFPKPVSEEFLWLGKQKEAAVEHNRSLWTKLFADSKRSG